MPWYVRAVTVAAVEDRWKGTGDWAPQYRQRIFGKNSKAVILGDARLTTIVLSVCNEAYIMATDEELLRDFILSS